MREDDLQKSREIQREPLITRTITFSVPRDGDFILDVILHASDCAKMAMQGEHYWDYLKEYKN